MILESLSVRNFRNLADQELAFHPDTNLFLGDNGQGKTNVLEAIYFLATTRSFRTSHTQNVIRIGATSTRVEGRCTSGSVAKTLAIGLDVSAGRKRLLEVNGQRATVSAYVSHVHPFAYSAARLEIVRGGPEARRRFLDRGIASIRPVYLADLTRYNRALQQRNALLQKIREREARPAGLEAWDAELVRAALPIVTSRQEYVRRLVEAWGRIVAAHRYHVEQLEIEYQPGGLRSDRESALEALRELRNRELAAGFSLAGPHRDTIDFRYRGMKAEEILSSGEQKMLVLFLKLAKMDIYTAERSEAPLFILDDIDAELDVGIIERVLANLIGRVQLCTSSAKERFFNDLRVGPHRRFRVEAGVVLEAGERAV